MGLIKTAMESIKGTIRDQHQTAINCDNMDNDLLMVKRTKANGIIRNGSIIIVNPGQMAVIIDNGAVIDASAEPGAYEWNSNASPSFFAGNFGGVFSEMWRRFAFGGGTYQDQAVYFINTKENIGNGFGTASPVMYRDWEHCMSDMRRPGHFVPMRVDIQCHGKYTFTIKEPWTFLQRIGGTANMYFKTELTDQLKVDIIAIFQELLNSLCSEQNQVYPLDLPSKGSSIIRELLAKEEFDAPVRKRGLRIEDIKIEVVKLDDESKAKIDRFERTGDQFSQQDRMVDVMQSAASNKSGAAMGFLNLNMMNQAAGGMIPQGVTQGAAATMQNQYPQQMPHGQGQSAAPYGPPPAAPPQAPAQQTPVPAPSAAAGVPCASCGKPVAGKFCAECGAPAPAPAVRFCTNCGAQANGKFCAECGTPLA